MIIPHPGRKVVLWHPLMVYLQNPLQMGSIIAAVHNGQQLRGHVKCTAACTLQHFTGIAHVLSVSEISCKAFPFGPMSFVIQGHAQT